MLYTILIILLVLALVGGIPNGFYGTGYYGGGTVSVLLIILIVLLLTGRI